MSPPVLSDLCYALALSLLSGVLGTGLPGLGTEHLYIRASLVAQLVKNLPAMQETLVRFLGWENLLKKG